MTALSRPDVRRVVLVGPPEIGKKKLADSVMTDWSVSRAATGFGALRLQDGVESEDEGSSSGAAAAASRVLALSSRLTVTGSLPAQVVSRRRTTCVRIWPLSPDEFTGRRDSSETRDFRSWQPAEQPPDDEALRLLGGIPLLAERASMHFSERWSQAYVKRLLRRNEAHVSSPRAVAATATYLLANVGQPVSLLKLGRAAGGSPVGAEAWWRELNQCLLGFTLDAFDGGFARTIKVQKKFYPFHWLLASTPAARFEAYVAVQLARVMDAWTTRTGVVHAVQFLRDQDRRTIAFVLLAGEVPLALVDVAYSLRPQVLRWPKGLAYYGARLGVPSFLLVPRVDQARTLSRRQPLGLVCSSAEFFAGLG